MPEEINRVATDHCSDRLYAPTPAGIENLRNENLAERTVFSGDVMRDTVIRNLAIAERRQQKSAADNPEPYAVLTLHRPVNTEPEVLQSLLPALDAIAQKTVPLVFPVHPRIKAAINSPGFSLSPAIKLVEPLAYLEMLCTVKGAQFVLTDSGGLQKEAAFLGTQCITLRDETEWTETVDIGVNRLTGVDTNAIQRAVDTAMSQQFDTETMAALDRCFGDGNAAEFIVQDLISNFSPRY
jgi:UDP-GlcNAc3NAcA epimerase